MNGAIQSLENEAQKSVYYTNCFALSLGILYVVDKFCFHMLD